MRGNEVILRIPFCIALPLPLIVLAIKVCFAYVKTGADWWNFEEQSTSLCGLCLPTHKSTGTCRTGTTQILHKDLPCWDSDPTLCTVCPWGRLCRGGQGRSAPPVSVPAPGGPPPPSHVSSPSSRCTLAPPCRGRGGGEAVLPEHNITFIYFISILNYIF